MGHGSTQTWASVAIIPKAAKVKPNSRSRFKRLSRCCSRLGVFRRLFETAV
jgi:hypothetical protein